MKIEKIYPRDIVAFLSLAGCFVAKCLGYDGKVDLVIVAIIGYYFSKRVYEEKGK